MLFVSTREFALIPKYTFLIYLTICTILYHWAVQATVEVETFARPFTLGEEDDMQEQNELSLKTRAKKCEKEWALDINHVEEVKILQDVARSRFRFITRFEGEKLEKISLI